MQKKHIGLLLAVLTLGACAHQKGQSAAAPVKEISFKGWSLGMSSQQVQQVAGCPQYRVVAPGVIECPDYRGVDDKPRRVTFRFVNDQLTTIRVDFTPQYWDAAGETASASKQLWKQAATDLVACIRHEWPGTLRIDEIRNGEVGMPLGEALWKAVHREPSPDEEQGVYRPVTLYSKNPRAWGYGEVDTTGVYLYINPADGIIRELQAAYRQLGRAEKIASDAIAALAPFELKKLPGFAAFTWGMPRQRMEQTLARMNPTPPMTCTSDERQEFTECKYFPILQNIQATVAFFTPTFDERPGKLRGVRVSITRPEGQLLKKRQIVAAIRAQLDLMRQGLGPLAFEGDSATPVTVDNVLRKLNADASSSSVKIVSVKANPNLPWLLYGRVEKTRPSGGENAPAPVGSATTESTEDKAWYQVDVFSVLSPKIQL